MPEASEILEFWFADALANPAALEARVQCWFGADAELDAGICERFEALPERARNGELDAWLGDSRAAVALILVLDQFPRNLWRGKVGAFECDDRALEIALGWIDRGDDLVVEAPLAVFGYLPLEHAEDTALQRRSLACYEALEARVGPSWQKCFQGFTAYARSHQEIVERFGRFPHRNEALGRSTTEAESAWLRAGGETFGG